MLLLYTAFCVILLYLSDVSLLNRLLRFLTILRFDVSLPNGYPRFFVSLRCFALLFPSLYAIVSPILRYCFLALRYCFLRFTLLFPRFRRLFLPFCAIVSSLYAIVSFALRYCFLRFTLLFPRFTLLFPRFTLLFPLFALLFPRFTLLFPRFTLLFPLFALLFPRFTLWLCTLSDGCAYASLFADRGSIDHIDGLKCAQRYFFFFQYDQNSTLSSNKTIERSNCCSTLRRSTRRNARILLHRSAFRSPNVLHIVLKL